MESRWQIDLKEKLAKEIDLQEISDFLKFMKEWVWSEASCANVFMR